MNDLILLQIGVFAFGAFIIAYTTLMFVCSLVDTFIKNSWFVSPETNVKRFSYSFTYIGFSIYYTFGITLIYIAFALPNLMLFLQ